MTRKLPATHSTILTESKQGSAVKKHKKRVGQMGTVMILWCLKQMAMNSIPMLI